MSGGNETIAEIMFDVPKGNLTAMANDVTGVIAVGVIALLWHVWIVISMLVSWQNSAFTATYNPPITYIFTLTGTESIWNSFLPSSYFISWIVNFVLFFPMVVAWIARDSFLVVWVYVGLYGGLVLAAVPWVFALLYITIEYPTKFSNEKWQFIAWSAEFWMLTMQGSLWIVSSVVHAWAIGPIIRMVSAR